MRNEEDYGNGASICCNTRGNQWMGGCACLFLLGESSYKIRLVKTHKYIYEVCLVVLMISDFSQCAAA